MLVVRVELHPPQSRETRELARMEITNTLEFAAQGPLGNYRVVLMKPQSMEIEREGKALSGMGYTP
jgi:hypothetical protein